MRCDQFTNVPPTDQLTIICISGCLPVGLCHELDSVIWIQQHQHQKAIAQEFTEFLNDFYVDKDKALRKIVTASYTEILIFQNFTFQKIMEYSTE
jgi:hypothetical protein